MGVAPPRVVAMGEPEQCEHEWTLVNRDENRLIYKCVRCGALREE